MQIMFFLRKSNVINDINDIAIRIVQDNQSCQLLG